MAKRRLYSRRKPSPRWLWAAAIGLALAGPTAYVIWDTPLLWWLAPLSALPLYFLLDGFGEQSRKGRGTRQHFNTGDSGPWTPPDGL